MPESVLDSLLAQAPRPLLVLRSDVGHRGEGQIVWSNGSAAELLGRPGASLAGEALEMVLGEGGDSAGLLAAVADDRAFEGTAAILDAGGQEILLEMRLLPLPDRQRHMALWLEPRRSEEQDPARLIELLRFCAGPGGRGFYLLAVGDDLRLAPLWADERAAALWGLCHGQARREEDWLARVPQEDRPLLRRRNQQLLGGRETSIRYRLMLEEGGFRHVSDRCRPIGEGRDGLVGLVVGAIADDEPEPGGGGPIEAPLDRLAMLLAPAVSTLAMVDRRGAALWPADRLLADRLTPAGEDARQALVGRAFAEGMVASGRLEPAGGGPALEARAVAIDATRALLVLDAPQQISLGLEEEAGRFEGAPVAVEVDEVTGLPVRAIFEERVNAALRRARGRRSALAVMRLALDRFDRVNASFGFAAGDAMLRVIAERLARALPEGGFLARLGGDEFLVLVEGAETADSVTELAQRLVEVVRPPSTVVGPQAALTASLGVALFPRDGDDCDELLHKAGAALARAREEGRDRHQLFTNELNATPLERLLLEGRLRQALEQGEFTIYYQPQACLRTGRIVGVEALLRWSHPEDGLVPPGEFIPLAEETGLIVPIGAWVLEAACRDMRRWEEELGGEELRLAVNLSARQFQQTDLVAVVDQILADTGFPPERLELELTESVVMSDAVTTTRRLRQLTALGLRLAIDDFGTGYSSLSYLRKFPISSLKIDRGFIQDIDGDPNSAAIVQAIIALASSLGLRVVGEGVEKEQQLRQLRLFGCHEMQGFLLSRPMPLEQLARTLRGARLAVEP
ncbi:EAL domain-containing protein [Geminicoccaceae bacterium 1502E]|nr:EAL domain-containing protein [Geminicoccaceae bacterium 1502E]